MPRLALAMLRLRFFIGTGSTQSVAPVFFKCKIENETEVFDAFALFLALFIDVVKPNLLQFANDNISYFFFRLMIQINRIAGNKNQLMGELCKFCSIRTSSRTAANHNACIP